jgi:predicted MPP superfamily phosphohydrolase
MLSIFTIVMLALCASQVYWFWRASVLVRKATRKASARLALGATALGLFLLMVAYAAGWVGRKGTNVRLTPGDVLLVAPLSLWLAISLFAALLLAVYWLAVWLVRAPTRIARLLTPAAPPEIESPSRRVFLNRAASVVAAAPFVAGVYGVFRGRLDLETPRQPILLPKLPAAFEGFRIAQLSDFHIGPFMTQEQLRKYAAIANALKPDLTVVTGDFVTWDPATQQAVVEALSGLTAPFGVFGCLGNHDAWAGVQDSITLLFRRAGIRILRHERVSIPTGGDSLNLIGVDYASRTPMGPSNAGLVKRYLEGAGELIDPGRVNILLSHNPNTFDRAAELGIDLSLAGHTHGGQAALEFISPEIAPSRLVTPYVAGLFQKPGGQLYVNRGLGTVGPPIRIGAPPEITLFELKRG